MAVIIIVVVMTFLLIKFFENSKSVIAIWPLSSFFPKSIMKITVVIKLHENSSNLSLIENYFPENSSFVNSYGKTPDRNYCLLD